MSFNVIDYEIDTFVMIGHVSVNGGCMWIGDIILLVVPFRKRKSLKMIGEFRLEGV